MQFLSYLNDKPCTESLVCMENYESKELRKGANTTKPKNHLLLLICRSDTCIWSALMHCFLLNTATPFTKSSFWSSLLSSGCDHPYLPYSMPHYLLYTSLPYFFFENTQHLLICCYEFYNPDATHRLIAAIPEACSGDKNLCHFSSQGNWVGGQLMETITRFLKQSNAKTEMLRLLGCFLVQRQ